MEAAEIRLGEQQRPLSGARPVGKAQGDHEPASQREALVRHALHADTLVHLAVVGYELDASSHLPGRGNKTTCQGCKIWIFRRAHFESRGTIDTKPAFCRKGLRSSKLLPLDIQTLLKRSRSCPDLRLGVGLD